MLNTKITRSPSGAPGVTSIRLNQWLDPDYTKSELSKCPWGFSRWLLFVHLAGLFFCLFSPLAKAERPEQLCLLTVLNQTTSAASQQVGENWVEFRDDAFFARGDLHKNGELEMQLYLKNGFRRSQKLRGHEVFAKIISHFGVGAKKIVAAFFTPSPSSKWRDADDYFVIKEYLEELLERNIEPSHRSLQAAVRETWLYQQAKSLGFANIEIVSASGDLTQDFEGVLVHFTKP